MVVGKNGKPVCAYCGEEAFPGIRISGGNTITDGKYFCLTSEKRPLQHPDCMDLYIKVYEKKENDKRFRGSTISERFGLMDLE